MPQVTPEWRAGQGLWSSRSHASRTVDSVDALWTSEDGGGSFVPTEAEEMRRAEPYRIGRTLEDVSHIGRKHQSPTRSVKTARPVPPNLGI